MNGGLLTESLQCTCVPQGNSLCYVHGYQCLQGLNILGWQRSVVTSLPRINRRDPVNG